METLHPVRTDCCAIWGLVEPASSSLLCSPVLLCFSGASSGARDGVLPLSVHGNRGGRNCPVSEGNEGMYSVPNSATLVMAGLVSGVSLFHPHHPPPSVFTCCPSGPSGARVDVRAGGPPCMSTSKADPALHCDFHPSPSPSSNTPLQHIA